MGAALPSLPPSLSPSLPPSLPQVVVGTTSITGKNVLFNNLGLVVVDEEQRLGVSQKEKLKVPLALPSLPPSLHPSLPPSWA